RSSNQQLQILEWLARLVAEEFTGASPLRVLSVGCGSGILDLPLLDAVAADGRKVIYTAVDPNPVACRRFREGFEALNPPNVELVVLEHGIERLEPDLRFDLIHAVHSLYYLSDPADSIDNLLGRLAPQGRLAVLQAPKAELNLLSDCFWPTSGEDAIWFSGCVRQHLDDSGLAFREDRIDAKVDVTPCFEDKSSGGRMLLDFITQADSDAFHTSIKEGCRTYLRSVAETVSGQVMVEHPVDAFVVEPCPASPTP
ncbi:MAG: class I SAM-dependent methyltransferase, partial [Planctomycetota bacterium]